jgi:hypothetical protein
VIRLSALRTSRLSSFSYMALQLFYKSFGLLNQLFLPSFPILCESLPIWHLKLLYVFSDIVHPAYFRSTCRPSCHTVPAVYCFYHSRALHPFNMTDPAQSLCSDEIYDITSRLYPQEIFLLFLKEAESTPGVYCGRKDYVDAGANLGLGRLGSCLGR